MAKLKPAFNNIRCHSASDLTGKPASNVLDLTLVLKLVLLATNSIKQYNK